MGLVHVTRTREYSPKQGKLEKRVAETTLYLETL